MSHMSLEELRVISATHTCARIIAKTTLRGRYNKCINSFVGKDGMGLNAALLESGSVIVGSAARYILSAPCIWRPRDLNILVPIGNQSIVSAFLESKQFVRLEGFPYTPIHTNSFVRYQRSLLIVTIEESLTDSIFPVLLSKLDTSLAMIVTPYGFIDFYPLLSSAGVRLCNRHRTTIERDAKTFNMGFTTAASTIAWQAPCGSACPRINRRICFLEDAEFMDWTEGVAVIGSDKIQELASRSHFKWRLGGLCFNTHCSMCHGL